jgi:hypothetical protein
MSTAIGHETETETAAAEAVEHMSRDVLQSLAALAGAPEGVAELALNAFPRGTRMWMITYGLAVEADGQLQITDRGRAAIEVAAARCPAPFADVAVGDLADSTREGLERLAQVSGIRLQEPQGTASSAAREDSSARIAGQRLGLFVSERLLRRRHQSGEEIHTARASRAPSVRRRRS